MIEIVKKSLVFSWFFKYFLNFAVKKFQDYKSVANGKWLDGVYEKSYQIPIFMRGYYMRLRKQFTSTVNSSLDENDKAEVIANVWACMCNIKTFF